MPFMLLVRRGLNLEKAAASDGAVSPTGLQPCLHAGDAHDLIVGVAADGGLDMAHARTKS
jgi:hypothetical protein